MTMLGNRGSSVTMAGWVGILAWFLFAPATADTVLENALKAGQTQTQETYRVTWEVKRPGDPIKRIHFDPTEAEDARWQLASVGGQTPTAEQRAAFREGLPRYRPAVGLGAVQDLIGEAWLKETQGTIRIYGFKPDPSGAPSEHEAGFYDRLVGEVRVDLTSGKPRLTEVHIHAPDSFKPAPPARIEVYERRYRYSYDGEYAAAPVLAEFYAHTRGEVFFDRFANDVIYTLHKLKPVNVTYAGHGNSES